MAKAAAAFIAKKAKILESLARPSEAYSDASPKGSVDELIRELIDQINSLESCVTTSSCSGRISSFLEAGPPAVNATDTSHGENGTDPVPRSTKGDIASDDQDAVGGDLLDKDTSSGRGPKGEGGRWLFVSHEPVHAIGDPKSASPLRELFGLASTFSNSTRAAKLLKTRRYVHLKFEPMIMHIAVADLSTAQAVLAAAQQSGFRESGVSSVTSACPMVAVRTQGLALDSIIGELEVHTPENREVVQPLVSEDYLKTLVDVVCERFKQNKARIDRFAELMRQLASPTPHGDNGDWELPAVRAARKRAEGLQRQRDVRHAATPTKAPDPTAVQDCTDILGFATP